MAEGTEVAIVSEENIHEKIYVIRGQKVMLDFELAEIYGYTTTRFNEQVKNNIEKFDDDFMFELTKEEFENLMSKKSTSSWGGRRKLPKVFTEQGIYEERQSNGQWLKSMEFKLPIIKEDMKLRLDNDSHVETVCLLSRKAQ